MRTISQNREIKEHFVFPFFTSSPMSPIHSHQFIYFTPFKNKQTNNNNPAPSTS